MLSKRLCLMMAGLFLATGCGMNAANVKKEPTEAEIADFYLKDAARVKAEADTKAKELTQRAAQLAKAVEGIAEDHRKAAVEEEGNAARLYASICTSVAADSVAKCVELKRQAEAARQVAETSAAMKAWKEKAKQPHLFLRVNGFTLPETTVVSSTLPSGSGFSYDVDAARKVVGLKSGDNFVATFYKPSDFKAPGCVAMFADGQVVPRPCL